MNRRICYDLNGNEIYNDAPTYAQEQLADIERRRTAKDESSNESIDELKSQIKKYKMALGLASVDVVKYIEEGLEGCDVCPERAFCEAHRNDMMIPFDCGEILLESWKEKAGLV